MIKIEDKMFWMWIDQQSEFDRLVEQLLQVSEIALDTEFHRERTYYPKLALLQLGWKGGVALIDPLMVDLRPLAQVFDHDIAFVMHAGTQDLEILLRAVGSLPRAIFDTQIAAGFMGFSNPSLALLSDKLLGINLVKGDRLTDWTKRPLSESQLRYAASDVFHLLDLKEVIAIELEELGRLGWAEDECQVLLDKDRRGIPLERAWWKIRECRHLKGDSRKVAQSLASWRESRAARLDIPARYVLSDLAVAAISQDVPSTVDRLMALRGVEQRQIGTGVAEEILHTIEVGRKLSDSAIAVPSTEDSDKKLKPVVSLSIIWANQLAKQLRVDASLLATRSDISSFFRGEADTRLASGWRHEILGEPLNLLARGELALAVNSEGELDLEIRSHLPFTSTNSQISVTNNLQEF